MCPSSGKGQVFYNDVLMFPAKLLSLNGEYIELKFRVYILINLNATVKEILLSLKKVGLRKMKLSEMGFEARKRVEIKRPYRKN